MATAIQSGGLSFIVFYFSINKYLSTTLNDLCMLHLTCPLSPPPTLCIEATFPFPSSSRLPPPIPRGAGLRPAMCPSGHWHSGSLARQAWLLLLSRGLAKLVSRQAMNWNRRGRPALCFQAGQAVRGRGVLACQDFSVSFLREPFRRQGRPPPPRGENYFKAIFPAIFMICEAVIISTNVLFHPR